ncbi:hypothetical protein ACFL3N_00430 [Candidatus Omnitrophota bacterium]
MLNPVDLRKKKELLTAAALCLIIVLAFSYSVWLRKDLLGRELGYLEDDLTAFSVIRTRNWLSSGALRSRFLLRRSPQSIEHDGLPAGERDTYVSYPPGTYIPVFFIAKFFEIDDLITLYRIYNLFNHLIISLFIFLVMFQTIRYFRNIDPFTLFFSIAPSAIYLFNPMTMYYHQNVFGQDTAVMTPFVIFIYMEMRRFLFGRMNRLETMILAAIVFFGVLTDWLFVFIVFTAFVLRILSAPRPIDIRRLIAGQSELIIPALLAMGLFFYQVLYSGLFHELLYKFTIRTARVHHGRSIDLLYLYKGIVRRFIMRGFGPVLLWTTVFSLIAFFLLYVFVKSRAPRSDKARQLDAYAYLTCLSTLPCLLKLFFLQNHAVIHFFAALKFALPLSLIPFGIVPIALNQLSKNWRYRVLFNRAVFFSFLIPLVLVFNFISRERLSMFYRGKMPYDLASVKKLGELIERNTAFNDICFSTDFDLVPDARKNRYIRAYSEKLVYGIDSLKNSQTRDRIPYLFKKGAVVKIFVHENRWGKLKKRYEKACSNIYRDSDYYICEITDADAFSAFLD